MRWRIEWGTLLCAAACATRPSNSEAISAASSVEVPFHPLPGANAIVGATSHAALVYASTSSAQTLDLFLPQRGTKPYPVVFRIHGGGFDSGSARMVELGAVAERIVAAGYALVAVNYRLVVEAPFPAAARDVKAAVRYLRANAARWDLDATRFAAWGNDSGGWFAAMLGVTGDQATVFDDASLGNAGVSSAVQAVVDWYGPTDFAAMDVQNAEHPPVACIDTYRRHSGAGTSDSRWLCGDREMPISDPRCAASVRNANLIHYVATAHELPSFAIAHGADDCELPWAQSVALFEALRKRDVPATYHKTARSSHADPKIEAAELDHAFETLARAFRPSK